MKFDLPKTLAAGDGLLTILVEDGGVTESISKSIPIVQKKLALAFFPEGGKMVAGLPTRLYFEAKTLLGKPADVEGRLVDDLGNAVATFATYKNGLGRLDFTPATGRTYQAEITRPATVTEKYALPLAEDKGCVLRTYDDFDGQEKALRVAVRCTEKQKVVVAATVRENVIDAGTIEAGGDAPSVIYLAAADDAIQRAAGRRAHHRVRPESESAGRASRLPQSPRAPRREDRAGQEDVHAARPGRALDHHARCGGQGGSGRARACRWWTTR